MTGIIDHHTPVLMSTQKLLQELVVTLIPQPFTILLLLAMASCVLHLKMTAYSHVLFVQSNHLKNK